MDPTTQRFNDLELAIDDTHALFEQWITEVDVTNDAASDTLCHARLVLHEWLANLVQHADFQGRTPEVSIRVHPTRHKVHCIVVDNSAGFEFTHRLEAQTTNASPFPERAMGLRLIEVCTESLSYHHTDSGLHQLEFSISTDHTPWLSNLF